MKNTLEDLWFSYLIEEGIALSDSDRIIVNSSSQKREEIYNTLSQTQRQAFEKYEENTNDMLNIYEKEAFIKGIKFATKFFINSLSS